MKLLLILILLAIGSTATLSYTGILWSHDAVLPNSTLTVQYYSTAVVSIGVDNRPALLAQRSLTVDQSRNKIFHADVSRQELVLLRTDARGQLTESFVLNQTDQLHYSQMFLQPLPDGGFLGLYTVERDGN